MVAFPHVGAGPYGTSRQSSYSSSSDAPKLDAAQIENIFQQMAAPKEQAPATPSSSRFGWFSRQYNKKFSRRASSSKSESK
ncbi:uncharacterized protein N7469_006865 [Penicillium citrinum]|uniref:Uncharacterized protein n=2 Tax=Penicillium TaxID=5073 RepID=A0A9W9NVE8_PENCI|nr:uncharacterized protein N7469_006865 [Penicillium citrinum]KAJ5226859.1 hypothetical protein N7469_006865 [Penicillium citrinum]KAJ5568684.1 hypothetical protein N7450_011170 [Penicillium hetheringtonii]